MDFIFDFTPSTHRCDVIFLCVDKLSTMAYFIPTTTHIIIEETKKLFCDHAYKPHGLPKVILSNMDVILTSFGMRCMIIWGQIGYVHCISSLI
jgi:hypothetical protein